MLFDLHVHTRISPCSSSDLKDILTHARSKELGGVATRIGGKIRTRSNLIKALKDKNFFLHARSRVHSLRSESALLSHCYHR